MEEFLNYHIENFIEKLLKKPLKKCRGIPREISGCTLDRQFSSHILLLFVLKLT